MGDLGGLGRHDPDGVEALFAKHRGDSGEDLPPPGDIELRPSLGSGSRCADDLVDPANRVDDEWLHCGRRRLHSRLQPVADSGIRGITVGLVAEHPGRLGSQPGDAVQWKPDDVRLRRGETVLLVLQTRPIPA